MEIEATLALLQLSNGMLGGMDTAVALVPPCGHISIQEKHYLPEPVLIPLWLTKLFIPKPTPLHNVTATYSIIVIPQVCLLD